MNITIPILISLFETDYFKFLIELIKNENNQITNLILTAIDNLLDFGKKFIEENSFNPIIMKLESFSFSKILMELQFHSDEIISNKVEKIIEKHYDVEEQNF